MSTQYFPFLLLLVFATACKSRKTEINVADADVTIAIQPFEGIIAAQAQFVSSKLKDYYPAIIINKAIALPQSAFYAPRNRYRADSLIQFLKTQTAAGYTTVGLTNKDISTTKDEKPDWGVMGLGYCPGNACIASSFRVSKAQTNEQLFKVAIHELGHTFGLPHCPVKFCFMRDAEGKNPTNDETAFCAKCRAFLIMKGWTLK